MLLIIDGYNLIFTEISKNNGYKSSPPEYLENSRDQLISLLQSYNARKKYEIIVIFDGSSNEKYYSRQKYSNNIEVIFSNRKTTADDLIVTIISSYFDDRLVHNYKITSRNIRLVTSDHALAQLLYKYRIEITPTDEFIKELPLSENNNGQNDNLEPKEEIEQAEPLEKFVGPLPSEIAGWMKVFQEDEIMTEVRAHLWISGMVQGVFFRVRTKEKADELILSGWVKNMPTGAVEAVIEGDKGTVEEMIKWCHQGPSSAKVTKVDIKWEEPENIKGFSIKY